MRLLLLATIVLTTTVPVAAAEAPEGTLPVVFLPIALQNVVQAYPTPAKGMGTHHPDWCFAPKVGATWHYNWVGEVPECSMVESVPMIYCATHLDYIEAGHSVLMDSEWVMGFNEPDDARQANLAPEEAAAAWPRVEALAGNRKLVSPAVVWHTEWLVEFRDAYEAAEGHPPRLDALAVHCYTNNVEACKTQIARVVHYAELWGIDEVWVTEFMLWGDNAEEDMLGLVAWMESHPRITRYAWFPGSLTGEEDWIQYVRAEERERYLEHQLVTPDGVPTSWGRAYALAH